MPIHNKYRNPEETVSYTIYNEDSLYKAKNGHTGFIDYKNIDASTVVQAAIGGSSSGSTLHLRDAAYDIATRININKPMIFRGSGYGTILKNKSGVDLASILYGNATDVIIEDLRIEGNKATIAVDANYKCQGITIEGHNNIVRHCWIHDTYESGIDGGSAVGFKVEGNRIWETGQAGAAFLGHGVYLSYAEKATIKDNIITPSVGLAIKLAGSYGASYLGHTAEHSVVENNLCIGERIVFYGIRDLLISHNRIINSAYPIQHAYSGAADLATDVSINGNMIIGDGATASHYIDLQLPSDLDFINNTMVNCAGGLAIGAGSHIDVKGNTFNNCIVGNDVIFSQASDVKIMNNKIRNIKTRGIYFYAGSNGVISGNTILQTTKAAEIAIRLNATTYNKITNNRIENCATGISEDGATDYNQINLNQFINCTTPMVIVGANTKIKDNPGFVTENSGTGTGNGAEQAINHGLAMTPTRVILSEYNTGLAIPYESSPAAADHIHVTAVNGKTYRWYAAVV